jgi:hypothetical protein
MERFYYVCVHAQGICVSFSGKEWLHNIFGIVLVMAIPMVFISERGQEPASSDTMN